MSGEKYLRANPTGSAWFRVSSERRGSIRQLELQSQQTRVYLPHPSPAPHPHHGGWGGGGPQPLVTGPEKKCMSAHAGSRYIYIYVIDGHTRTHEQKAYNFGGTRDPGLPAWKESAMFFRVSWKIEGPHAAGRSLCHLSLAKHARARAICCFSC